VKIECDDRRKLLFDTLCTLADKDYEVYHATIITRREEKKALQDFYIRPRFGEGKFDKQKANVLKDLLISAIARRSPHGLKAYILTSDQPGLLWTITDMLKSENLQVTR